VGDRRVSNYPKGMRDGLPSRAFVPILKLYLPMVHDQLALKENERKTRMSKSLWVVAACAMFGLTACGQSDLERTATGAVMGAAAGQVIAGDPTTGALIGGAAGASCRSLGTCPRN
jgi:osmotically inducible lipoprotein OsmB